MKKKLDELYPAGTPLEVFRDAMLGAGATEGNAHTKPHLQEKYKNERAFFCLKKDFIKDHGWFVNVNHKNLIIYNIKVYYTSSFK